MFFLGAARFSVAQYAFSETLPALSPASPKLQSIIVPFENIFEEEIKIESISTSCGCTDKVVFAATRLNKGEKTTGVIGFNLNTGLRVMEIEVKVRGRRLGLDEKSYASLLATYSLEIPIVAEVSLSRKSEMFQIRDDTPCEVQIVNSGKWRWANSAVLASVEDQKIDASVSEIEIVDRKAQTFAVRLESAKELKLSDQPEHHVQLEIFAAPENQRALIRVATLKVPLRRFASIEVFPKTISRDEQGNWLPINLVGRSVLVGTRAGDVRAAFADDAAVPNAMFEVVRSTDKWLKLQLRPSFEPGNNSDVPKLKVFLDEYGLIGSVQIR